MNEINRRKLLVSVAISGSVGTLAGCLDRSSTQNDSETVETNTQSPSPTDTATEIRSTDRTDTPTEDQKETATDTETQEEEEEETATDSPESNWYIRPDGSPKNTPSALKCEEDGTNRYQQRFQESGLVWGEDNGWKLRVDSLSAEYGGTIKIRLTNTSDKTRNRGANSKYNLQVKTTAGWQDIRVWHDENGPPVPPSEAITQDPDETHDWTITIDEQSQSATVCPDLQSGRYRFAYYGFDGSENPDAVAVAFDLDIG